MTDKTNKESSDKLSKTAYRKPYLTPAFRWERAFEVSALSCGKVFTTQATCRASRKAS